MNLINRRRNSMWLYTVGFLLLLCVPLSQIAWTAQVDAGDQPRILLFSKTEGFRHGSIPDAIAAIEALGAEYDFLVDKTEESAFFTDANLAPYDAIVWLMTTGDVLNDAEQAAFERYIRAGGGYVGVHSASDTEYDWPWYGDLMGAFFQNHPQIQTATINVEDSDHGSTAHLGTTWVRNDEWYNYRSNPRSSTNVLLTLDESTYEGGEMGDHPIAWYHEFDGGRAWYTGGGHTAASYSEPDFVQHLLGGIEYAAGISNVTPTPSPTEMSTATPASTPSSTPLPTLSPEPSAEPTSAPLPCHQASNGGTVVTPTHRCSFLPFIW